MLFSSAQSHADKVVPQIDDEILDIRQNRGGLNRAAVGQFIRADLPFTN